MAPQPLAKDTATKVKPKEATAEIVKEIKIEPKAIAPSAVKVNSEGFACRTLLVRMPEGMTADDMRSPQVWRKAQLSPQTALRKLDHLLILTYDEKQIVRAICTHASSTEAFIAIERVSSFREMGQAFYTDGTLEVFWDGGGYGYRRVSDQIRLSVVSFTTESAAIAGLHSHYPARGAA